MDHHLKFIHWVYGASFCRFKTTIGICEDRILLIMEDSPVHCSRIFRNYLKKKILLVNIPDTILPEQAPVELLFGRLKKLVSTKRTKSVIDLDHESGRQKLKDAVVSIDRVLIMKICSRFLSITKQIIDDLDSILKINN